MAEVSEGKGSIVQQALCRLSGFIWLFLFFMDGRYVACACSRWGGEYTETGALLWCKPKGNETEVFKRQQETQKCDTISQFVAFGTAFVALIIMGISYFYGYRFLQTVEMPLNDMNNGERGESQ
ncbi:hypothetical protein KOW79_021632 [Hemibagrus wyckioides]|uniref:Uncharacterized protein n=1 Tax=Hemibagrus wyckioides TaxID=337641 RepID=A0A9D3SD24_9TELE|nr:hypothetical protein KOW79_021632 [Hemibagrus wyckioides]